MFNTNDTFFLSIRGNYVSMLYLILLLYELYYIVPSIYRVWSYYIFHRVCILSTSLKYEDSHHPVFMNI